MKSRPQPAPPARDYYAPAEQTQRIARIAPVDELPPMQQRAPAPPPPVRVPTAEWPLEPAAEPTDDEAETQLSRAARRRAEKDAGRRTLMRRGLQLAAVLLTVFLVITLVVVFTGGSTPKGRAASAPTPTATAANLADPDLVAAFLGSAASDISAVTTYDYRHLDDALNAGLAVTVGPYHEAYRTALTGDLARTATAEHVVHTFEVLDIGIGTMNATGTRAKVLVFGRERITDDRTGPGTDVVPITLCATMRRDGNRYRISDLAQGADAGLPPGGPDLRVAAAAARAEVIDLLSYRRTDFDAGLQRALDGATSPLREQIQKSAAATEHAMKDGKFDSSGTVTTMAVVRADADTVTFLVAADASKLVDGKDAPSVRQNRYEVTVTHTLDGWAASRVTSVDGDA